MNRLYALRGLTQFAAVTRGFVLLWLWTVALFVSISSSETTPFIRVVGIVISPNGSWAFLKGVKRTYVVAVGEKIGDYVVYCIRPDGVIFKYGSFFFYVPVESGQPESNKHKKPGRGPVTPKSCLRAGPIPNPAAGHGRSRPGPHQREAQRGQRSGLGHRPAGAHL